MRKACVWTAAATALSTAMLLAGGCGPAKRPVAGAKGAAAEAGGAQAKGEEKPDPKEQTRMPWSRPPAGFVRAWLLCGPFPSPPHAGQQGKRHPAGQGFDRDFLQAVGGEAAARPQGGQKVQRPDGTQAEWKPHTAGEDVIDLRPLFEGGASEDVVAYAYTTIRREQSGKAVLALGSDDSVKVFLNGKRVHDHTVGRSVRKDEDIVPVALKRGDNALLLKVENNKGGWGFVVRVLSESQAAALAGGEIRPRIEPPAKDEPNVVIVRTDAGPAGGRDTETVHVEAVAPGGKVVARREARRGRTVRFDAADWPDGPYEVRVWYRMPAGYRVFHHLPWYKGRAIAQVIELLDRCDALPKRCEKPSQLRLRVLKRLVLDRLGGDPRSAKPPAGGAKPSPAAWQAVHPALMEHREVLAGEAAALRGHGFLRLAWRDEVDDSPQFARAYLPADYDAKRKWPMVVNLHGYNPSNPEYVGWWSVTKRHSRLAERHGIIELEPHGRGNTGYRGIGDADVLRAVAEAKRRFAVDDDRVYLTGYSMGGGGTWHVGTNHPELFAAIAPVYGGWDYHVWMDAEAYARLTPRRRYQVAGGSSFARAEALLSTPVFVNHGDSDALVDVEYSRYAVRMLQRWGYRVRYWEHPGKGHGRLGHEDELMRWFLAHRREANPRRVRVRAAHLKNAGAHWVRVEQREDPYAFMHVDAGVADRHTIRLDSENVLQVRLTPGAGLIDPARPVRVIWNGRAAGEHEAGAGGIVLRAGGYEPGKLHKTPAIAGPLDDVTTTPFAIVVGTASKDERMRRFCLLQAARARDAWRQWQHAAPRFLLDTEITPQQVRSYSLRLFGGPEENLVARELRERLPLKIAPDAITIGPARFPCEDAAVRMVYPHPLNAKRYVEVIAATSAAGMFSASHVPGGYDFAVAAARVTSEAAGFEGDEGLVAAGCFDAHWQYREAYAQRCEPKRLADAPVRKAPKHLSCAVDAKRLMLSEVLETHAEGSFAQMARDLNWRGRAIQLGGRTYPKGVGVAVWHEPCRATYDLTGGHWTRLRAVIGIEIDRPEKLEDKQKRGTRVYFVVRGDSKELYRSPTFGWQSAPVEMDVAVRGVKTLQLEVANEARWHNAASSVNWADLRLEK